MWNLLYSQLNDKLRKTESLYWSIEMLVKFWGSDPYWSPDWRTTVVEEVDCWSSIIHKQVNQNSTNCKHSHLPKCLETCFSLAVINLYIPLRLTEGHYYYCRVSSKNIRISDYIWTTEWCTSVRYDLVSLAIRPADIECVYMPFIIWLLRKDVLQS